MISIFWLWVFASTTQKTLLEIISEEKIKIENELDNSYTSVYKEFQSSVSWFLSSLDYQWLVCLWVIDDSMLLKQMQEDNKNLKVWFINSYSLLYANAADVEQKQRILKDTSVSLFPDWSSYEIEKERILKDMSKLSEDQKNFFNQFQISYKNKISQFVKDFYAYSEKNKDLLIGISTKIKTINLVEQNYKNLTSDLLKYQSKFGWSWNNFFNNLYNLKKSSMSWLDINFQYIIDKEVRRYKILPNLADQLKEQKTYALWLYELQFDEKINLLLDRWYDNKEFTEITQKVKQFSVSYKSWSKLQCSSFVGFSNVMEKSAADILAKIKLFNDNIYLSNSWNIDPSQFQDSLNKWVPVIIQLQNDITKTFITAISQKRQSLLDYYRVQNNNSWYQNNISQNDISNNIVSSFVFTKAFKKFQKHFDIKILQELLTKLWYYSWVIDSVYWPKTIEAVYKYQLDRGLLIWYENKPQTWGWIGPATRASLNKDLSK